MPQGGISIELSPAVVLDREIMRTHYLNLFPIDHGRKAPDDEGSGEPPF